MSTATKGDIFGRPLNTGDIVVIRSRYVRNLVLAKVIRTTAKRIRLVQINKDGTDSTWDEQVASAVFILDAAQATPETIKLLAQRHRENDT